MKKNKEEIKIPDPDYFDTRELLELMQNLNAAEQVKPRKEIDKVEEAKPNSSKTEDDIKSVPLKLTKKPRNRWTKVRIN
jgi:hypothetical protein